MSDDLDQVWDILSGELATWPGAAHGKMMSAPAVTKNGKVFAFYSTKGGITGFGFRIGRETNPDTLGLKTWQHLAPFKTKPPMKDWIIVGLDDRDHFEALARLSYEGLG